MKIKILAVATLGTAIVFSISACTRHNSEKAKEEIEAASVADKEAENASAAASATPASAPQAQATDPRAAKNVPVVAATPVVGAKPEPPPPGTCAGGKKMLVLKGPCPGGWKLNPENADKPSNCQYDWGPAIQCPAGTKAMGSPAACYGSLSMDIPPGDKSVKTVADCTARFGVAPKYFDYDMQCCPN